MSILKGLESAVRHAQGNPDAGTAAHHVEGSEVVSTTVAPEFDVEVYLRTGSSFTLDRVQVLETRVSAVLKRLTSLRVSQGDAATARLVAVGALDLDHVVAVVRRDRAVLGTPAEPEFVEDSRPSSDSRSARDLVWNFASKFEYMTATQASARLDVVLGLLTEKLGTPAPQPEGPAPLSELRQDSAPMLQLRRDVRWLEDRGFRGQTRVSDFSTAEMVGLMLPEFKSLSTQTRQKFEDRAYTALRTLNGGGR